MPERLHSIDMELSDFVVKLVEDTFDAIVVSYQSQFEKIGEIEGCLALSVEEFANQYVDEDDVSIKLEEIFGIDFARNGVITDVGYFFQQLKMLDIPAKVEKDIQKNKASSDLIGQILARIRHNIAYDRLKHVRKIAQKGIPRVLISGGEINARVYFKSEQSEGGQPYAHKQVTAKSQPATALKGKTFIKDKLTKSVLPSVKLSVTQVSGVKPSKVKQDGSGSITVRFDVV